MAKTADGIEVREGDTVWVSTMESRVVRRVDDGCLDNGAVMVGSGFAPAPVVWLPMERVWSSRIAALRAARERAAAEVARLDAEIAKEADHG